MVVTTSALSSRADTLVLSAAARRSGETEAVAPADTVELSRGHSAVSSQVAEHAALAAVPSPAAAVASTMLPDNHGRIGALALAFGNKEFDDPTTPFYREQVLGVYETLFKNMDCRTEFFVVCPNQEDADRVRQCADGSGMHHPERVKVLNANSENGFSIWIRDSMIPTAGPNGEIRLLVQNRRYWPGPDDDKVPYWLASMDPRFEVVPVPYLRVDGGNVLSDGTRTLAGVDSVTETQTRLVEIAGRGSPPPEATAIWEKAAEQALESRLGHPLVVIGKDDPNTEPREGQAIFHYDMGVTPMADGSVLVGDPSLGVAILEALTPEERAEVNRVMCEQAGVEPDRDLVGDLIRLNSSPEAQANFENTLRQLQAAGYNVGQNEGDSRRYRLPCLFGLDTEAVPYVTYNNCLQEDYVNDCGQRVRKVYLPQFACQPLDDYARSVYEEHGLEVVPLNMPAISILEGAIRCSAHPLYRTEN